MARRRNSGPAEALTGLMARLPWWVGVGLAVVSYLVLSPLADRPLPTPQPGQVGGLGPAALLKALATIGQIALPIIGLAGAALLFWKSRQRRQMLEVAASAPASDVLNGLDWAQFEVLVGEAFRRQGYQVVESGGGGPDGGVDLVLRRPAENGTEKVLVQCKHWKAFKVGVDVVRELYGVMAATGATAGIVVTSGRFTEEARDFAAGRNVKLIDGPVLHRMMQEVRSKGAGGQSTGRAVLEAASDHRASASPGLACPKCNGPMVKRVAKQGAHAGKAFYGCADFPKCKGTRELA